MLTPNLILFYCSNPGESARFYERIFGLKPVANFPTYVAFVFPNGLSFSLWSTQAKNFVSAGTGNRMELAFMVTNEDEARRLHREWKNLQIPLEQELHKAVFGLTFVALDPDGHRVRVCIPDK